MIYSHTQISQFLRCPRSYRYRYLDGWQEKETRAAMVFGRSFEKALGAYFCREDPSAVLYKEWGAYRDAPFEYKKGDSWDRLVHQGVHLLQKFAQDDRVRIRRPQKTLQVKMRRIASGNNESFPTLTPRRTRWHTLRHRLEDHYEPLSGRAEGLLALDLSSLATPGLAEFLRSQWSCSCARTSLRFNTFGPRFPKSNDGNTAGWLKPQLLRLKRASSFPTAASASLRTAA